MDVNLKATAILDSLDRQSIYLYGASEHYKNTAYKFFQHEFLRQFLSRSEKFFIGELENLPEAEVTEDILRLPFDETYVEAIDSSPDGTRARLCFLCSTFRSRYVDEYIPEDEDFRFAVRLIVVGTKGVVDTLMVWLVSVKLDKPEIRAIRMVGLDEQFDKDYLYREQQPVAAALQGIFEESIHKLLNFLAIISCSNVGTELVRPPEKLNKARVKKGDYPFFKFKTLSIKQHHTVKYMGGELLPGESGRGGPCLHWRRGHVRRLQSGKRTWVSSCMVGDPKKGIVSKTYKVIH